MSLQENIDFEVKKSALNGRGVFAKRPIAKGEVIFNWRPKVLTKTEADSLPADELNHYTYPEGDKILWMQPPERYINHSCEANTVVFKQSDVACRNIHLGEEITSDYIDIETENFICNCRTQNCRSKSRSIQTKD